jgi:protein-disulfide isomerase
MVDVDESGGEIPAIEVFDPLCPACGSFERRLESSDLGAGLDRKAVLFPLDDECNWMVQSALHPGACAISEAMLCAAEGGDVSPRQVMLWAFENRAEITSAAAAKEGGAASMVKKQFPGLEKCLGSASVRSKINKSLRWTVSNRLPVLTPQLYVDGVKLCDEDTDLGMDFALSRMLEMRKAGKLGGSKR